MQKKSNFEFYHRKERERMQALCDAYYEFWGIFPTVFFRVAMISFVLLVLFVWYFLWYDKKSQPTYISYKKNHFHEEFKFVCEFCGAVVSSTDEKCSNCAGTFGKSTRRGRPCRKTSL